MLFGVVSNWGCKCLLICNLPISRASFFGSAVILKIICFERCSIFKVFLLELLYCDIHSQMAGQGEQLLEAKWLVRGSNNSKPNGWSGGAIARSQMAGQGEQ